MWYIKKFSCFQVLTFLIFTWMLFDLTDASQEDHHNETVAKTETDAENCDKQLSEQLFDFAQIFSMVNNSISIEIKSDNNKYSYFKAMPEIGSRKCDYFTVIRIDCIEFTFTSNQWHNTR